MIFYREIIHIPWRDLEQLGSIAASLRKVLCCRSVVGAQPRGHRRVAKPSRARQGADPERVPFRCSALYAEVRLGSRLG